MSTAEIDNHTEIGRLQVITSDVWC